jgi:hypothetical protein
MDEEEILPPPLHFRKTATNLEVGSNLLIYLAIPSDWYHGPTNPVTVPINDCQDVDVSLEGEEPRSIKMGLNCHRKRL